MRQLRNLFRAVTGAGRLVAAIGAAAWLGGWLLGWREFQLVAGACLVLAAVASAFTLGRDALEVQLDLEPRRVPVGGVATAGARALNRGRRRTFGLRLEVPAGDGAAQFDVPGLAPDAAWSDVFVIPTSRRGILSVGPVTSVREDPLGLLRRAVAWSEPVELFIHPKIVRLPALVAGWIRDLEGRPTRKLSPSDIAFHTLREYVPGDDRRHVHWKSTARHGSLLVRQFVDSRRSHLGLILSTASADFASEDEFELAVSVVGSLGASALADNQAVSATTGLRPLPTPNATMLLDALSGVEAVQGSRDLTGLVRRSLAVLRGAGVVVLVVGSAIESAELRRAAELFQHDVRVLGIRIVPGNEVRLQRVGLSTLLELGRLEDLPRAIRATVAS